MDITLLNQARQEWTDFLNKYAEQQQDSLTDLEQAIAANDLRVFVAMGDFTKFDQTYNRLSDSSRYDEEMVADIYKVYVQRDMHELAYEYLMNAFQYLNDTTATINGDLIKLVEGAQDINLLKRFSITLDQIRGILPENIAKITPPAINDKRNLGMFILYEIVQAALILNDKRDAIKDISHENRFTDYLQAILRLRLPIWGWSIHDQPRVGSSPTGKTAGSADIVLQAAGKNIALMEALILRDKDYTQEHILKCPLYINSINKYYIVVYHLKSSGDFDANWETYKNDVLVTVYPPDFQIDIKKGFLDLNDDFGNPPNLKIAKTDHPKGIAMFHLMFNLAV